MSSETVEIAACKMGLPAETYYIPSLDFIEDNQPFARIQFCDLEKMPAPDFYRWLNAIAALCDLHTRFVECVDGHTWYESPSDRWAAIKTLVRIALLHGHNAELIIRTIYTERQAKALLAGR